MNASFTGAYAQAGYKLNNPRNQWSAIKEDESGVALTIWTDEINKLSEPWDMDLREHPRLSDWMGRVGNSVRKRHIQYSLDHCSGRFDLILCKAVDIEASPRKVEWARHWHQRNGVINSNEFDTETGAFRIELRAAGS